MVLCERSCHKEYTRTIWKPYHFWLESYFQGKSFSKVGQTSRSMSQGKKLWYHTCMKGLVITNTHMTFLYLMVWKLWPRLKFLSMQPMLTPTLTLGLWYLSQFAKKSPQVWVQPVMLTLRVHWHYLECTIQPVMIAGERNWLSYYETFDFHDLTKSCAFALHISN